MPAERLCYRRRCCGSCRVLRSGRRPHRARSRTRRSADPRRAARRPAITEDPRVGAGSWRRERDFYPKTACDTRRHPPKRHVRVRTSTSVTPAPQALEVIGPLCPAVGQTRGSELACIEHRGVHGLAGRRYLTPAPGANEGQVASVEGRGHPAHQAKPVVKASSLESRSRREVPDPESRNGQLYVCPCQSDRHFQLRL